MECNFSLEHYQEILDLAKDYKFVSFLEKPEGKVIYLRHDIDIALDKALELAKIEKEKQIKATYFVQMDSPFYDPKDERIKEIASLGHDIGLHYTKGDMKEQIATLGAKNIISFHRPSKEVFSKKIEGFVSAYEPYFFNEVKYISDSRGEWKEKCACQVLKEDQPLRLQLLTHPIWWGNKANNPTDILNDYLEKYPNKEELKEYLRNNIKTYNS